MVFKTRRRVHTSLFMLVAAGLVSCTPQAKQDAKTAADAAAAACAVLVPPQWAGLCALADSAIDDILAAQLAKAPPSAKVVQAPKTRAEKILLIVQLDEAIKAAAKK